MKKLVLISAIAMSGLFYNTAANAQIGIHIGFHLFPHRIFAPGPEVVVQQPVYQEPVVSDNDNCDDYYYLPDVGAYYSVDQGLYYYFDGNNWISAAYLPGEYHDYDWRSGRRFEIREARPYLHDDFYRGKYNGFDGNVAYNRDHFRGGFDYNNREAYNAPQRINDRGFDSNRGGYDQRFDNNRNDRNQGGFEQRDNGGNRNNQSVQQFNPNKMDDHQDQFAQNQKKYDGHNDGRRDRF